MNATRVVRLPLPLTFRNLDAQVGQRDVGAVSGDELPLRVLTRTTTLLADEADGVAGMVFEFDRAGHCCHCPHFTTMSFGVRRMRKPTADEWKLYGILAVTFLFGLGLIYFLRDEKGILGEVGKEIGVALMIAAILGATIDRFMKLSIYRDVFEASFQYILHPALKDEISRIMRYRLFAEQHELAVEIEKIAGSKDLVRVNFELHRRIRNCGSTPEKMRVLLHIDEWGLGKPNEIIDCYGALDDGTIVRATHRDLENSKINFVSDEEITLKPNRYIDLKSKWAETKHVNDMSYLNVMSPTIDPTIDIRRFPSDLQVVRFFGTASEEISEPTSGRQTVKGTHLPFHYMIIRWWPKDEAKVKAGRAKRPPRSSS